MTYIYNNKVSVPASHLHSQFFQIYLNNCLANWLYCVVVLFYQRFEGWKNIKLSIHSVCAKRETNIKANSKCDGNTSEFDIFDHFFANHHIVVYSDAEGCLTSYICDVSLRMWKRRIERLCSGVAKIKRCLSSILFEGVKANLNWKTGGESNKNEVIDYFYVASLIIQFVLFHNLYTYNITNVCLFFFSLI